MQILAYYYWWCHFFVCSHPLARHGKAIRLASQTIPWLNAAQPHARAHARARALP